jgi:type IV pilus assembly protein PilF
MNLFSCTHNARKISCFSRIKPLLPRRLLISWVLIALSTLSCATSTTTTTTTTPGASLSEGSAKEQALLKRNLGEAYIMQGNFTAALKELQTAEQLHPKDPITHYYLGIAYQNKELFEQAIQHYNKALDLNPGYSMARNNLGTVYLDMQNWDAAIACFKDVVADVLYATPHYPLANLGRAYYNKKEYSTSQEYFRKALQVKPNFIIALNGLGQTYMAEGKYPDAVAMFEKVVKYETQIPQFYFQLAKAYELTNDNEKAVKAYLKVVELSPDSDMAEEARKKVGK